MSEKQPDRPISYIRRNDSQGEDEIWVVEESSLEEIKAFEKRPVRRWLVVNLTAILWAILLFAVYSDDRELVSGILDLGKIAIPAVLGYYFGQRLGAG